MSEKVVEMYKIAVENLALTNDPDIFNNSGPEHASIVLGTIFKNSKKGLNILAGGFYGEVPDSPLYVDSLQFFLESGKPLNLLFEQMPNENSKSYQIIKKLQKRNGNIIIKIIQSPFLEPTKIMHFTTADSRMFRLETSKKDFTAYCSFNRPELTNQLNKYFFNLFNDEKIVKEI